MSVIVAYLVSTSRRTNKTIRAMQARPQATLKRMDERTQALLERMNQRTQQTIDCLNQRAEVRCRKAAKSQGEVFPSIRHALQSIEKRARLAIEEEGKQ